MHNDDYTTMPECGDLQRADTHNSAEVGCVFSCSALKHVLESTSKLRRVVHAVAGSCFTNVHQYSEYVHTLSGCILYYICFRCPCFCSKILEDRVALKISCESDLCSSCASTLIFCPDGRKCWFGLSVDLVFEKFRFFNLTFTNSMGYGYSHGKWRSRWSTMVSPVCFKKCFLVPGNPS